MCCKKETRRRQHLLFSQNCDIDVETLDKLYKKQPPEVKNWYTAFK